MIKAINASGFKPIIDKEFAFTDIVAASKHREINRHFGKIYLVNECLFLFDLHAQRIEID